VPRDEEAAGDVVQVGIIGSGLAAKFGIQAAVIKLPEEDGVSQV
jgi:hypothetical protein